MTRGFGRFAGSRWVDAAIVAGLAVADVTGIVVDTAAGRVERAAGVVALMFIAAAAAASFWWRRRLPVWVLGGTVLSLVMAGAIVEGGLLTHRSGVQFILAAFAASAWSTHRRAALFAPLALAILAAIGLAADGQAVVTVVAVPVAVFVAPWFAGYASRARRLYLAEVEHRLAIAEREAAERARLAVIEDRQLVARELHDVVAHHVSLIGVQAGAARVALNRDPAAAMTSLVAIEASSRHAVAEMRLLLETLRTGDADDIDSGHVDSGATAPMPGLRDVDRLIDDFRSAGLAVDGRIEANGEPDGSGPLGLTAYRIVEEALTNVARHSAADRCTVRISRSPEALRVVVDDPGPARNSPSATDGPAGFGLRGIRERVAAVGGRVTIGPRLGGGFLVDVTLPVGSLAA